LNNECISVHEMCRPIVSFRTEYIHVCNVLGFRNGDLIQHKRDQAGRTLRRFSYAEPADVWLYRRNPGCFEIPQNLHAVMKER